MIDGNERLEPRPRWEPRVTVEEIAGDATEVPHQTLQEALGGVTFDVVTDQNPDFDRTEGEYTFDCAKADISTLGAIGKAIKKCREHITQFMPTAYWWLDDKYIEAREAGKLTEQYTFATPFTDVDVYNLTGINLSLTHVEVMSDVLNRVLGQQNLPFNRNVPIVISEAEPGNVNALTGEPIKGRSCNFPIVPFFTTPHPYIQLFPTGMSLLSSEIEGMDILSLTIGHETGHGLNYDAKRGICGSQDKNWLDVTGWRTKDGETHSVLEAGAWALPESDRTPPRPYSRYTPEEDFADSFACLVLNPNLLDEERRDYLVKRLYNGVMPQANPEFKPKVIRRTGSAIELPRIEPREYTIKVILPRAA